MKVAVFSDTHNLHSKVILPECDLAIFAGDYSSRGSYSDTKSFLDWYNSQDQCKYKIWIEGNHDLAADNKFNQETEADMWLSSLLAKQHNLIHLENNKIEIGGIKIWGSPVTPDFYPEYWAFNMPRGEKIRELWRTIPFDTDIVVTHGPPQYILDRAPNGNYCGCADLAYVIEEIRPKYHIFGHIHSDSTKKEDRIYEGINTIYINAALCNNSYHLINQPIVFEIE